jgi:hypothetical protein
MQFLLCPRVAPKQHAERRASSSRRTHSARRAIAAHGAPAKHKSVEDSAI